MEGVYGRNFAPLLMRTTFMTRIMVAAIDTSKICWTQKLREAKNYKIVVQWCENKYYIRPLFCVMRWILFIPSVPIIIDPVFYRFSKLTFQWSIMWTHSESKTRILTYTWNRQSYFSLKYGGTKNIYLGTIN